MVACCYAVRAARKDETPLLQRYPFDNLFVESNASRLGVLLHIITRVLTGARVAMAFMRNSTVSETSRLLMLKGKGGGPIGELVLSLVFESGSHLSFGVLNRQYIIFAQLGFTSLLHVSVAPISLVFDKVLFYYELGGCEE